MGHSRSSLLSVWSLCLLASLPAALEAQSIRATVNSNRTTLNEPILLQITVEGAKRVEPQLPELADFEVMPRGSSSQVQIVNGKMSSSITYSYVLSPLRAGTFTIGAATVEIDGERYSSRPFQVRVLEGSAEPSESDLLFLRATVSNERPYVGEQILYTWRFYRRVQIADARLEPLEFGDLVAEDLGDVREYSTTVGGLEYLVSEIRKALFAQEAGTAMIPGSRLTTQVAVQPRRRRNPFDDFFGRMQTQSKVLTTPPIRLEVQPLPDPPASFSGLVGSFELRSSVSKRELQVGESVTYEMKLSGAGNVQMMGEISLPELSAFKSYPDKPVSSVERTAGGLEGSKIFRTALVPLQPGALTLPAVDVVFFDPSAEIFRTTSTSEVALDVRPAEGKEELMLTESVAPTTGKVAVRILADDILPIHRSLDALSLPVVVRVGTPLLALLWLLPPACFAALLFYRRREELYASDASLRRRRQALKRARKGLAALGRQSSAPPEELARDASRLLREYVGDKLAAEGGALTAAETEQLLLRAGSEEGLAREVRGFLDRLEAAQFGAGAAGVQSAALRDRLAVLLDRLERSLQGRRA